MKKLQPHWIGLAAWFAIVAGAVAACSGGSDGNAQVRQAQATAAAAAQPAAMPAR